MRKIVKRAFQLNLPRGRSAFLWGPRQVGKSYWIRHELPNAEIIDLLKSDVFGEYVSRPALLRERFETARKLVVIDEVQKIPALLDEVHWLIENRGLAFLLTGSSARKLKRGQANLLGGRAWRRTMVPLSYTEVQGFDLERVMTTGLLPPHYLSNNPEEDLRSYVGDYLKEEIAAEAAVKNIPTFNDFLRVAAVTSSELLNYTNVAQEVGISQRVVRSYFDILEDTYLGFRVPPWVKSKNRRMILTEKFYLFDVGIANHLSRRAPRIGSAEFGKSFEHFILMEIQAYCAYRQPDAPISFWRTAAGQEVDFIIGEKELALEVKGSSRVHAADVRHLSALLEDGPVKHIGVVCLENTPRRLNGKFNIWPWKKFLEDLWSGKFF